MVLITIDITRFRPNYLNKKAPLVRCFIGSIIVCYLPIKSSRALLPLKHLHGQVSQQGLLTPLDLILTVSA